MVKQTFVWFTGSDLQVKAKLLVDAPQSLLKLESKKAGIGVMAVSKFLSIFSARVSNEYTR